VAAEALRPTLFGLFGLTLVVLMASVLVYSDLIFRRGVPWYDVMLLLFFESVPVATKMFPFATLIGCLVALGRMGADREILVLEASGVAAARLVWPVVSIAAVMMMGAVLMSVYATPWANRSFDGALAEISRTKPWASLESGAVNEFGGWQLEARQVSAEGNELEGVLLWMPEVAETVFARRGLLGATPDGAIEITLEDGTAILPPRNGRVRQLGFEKATTVLPDSDTGLARTEKYRIPGMPIGELAERARTFVPTEAEKIPRAALELHRRFAYPVATLVFGFLAVPLFVVRGSYSRSGGGVLGLVATLVYYGLVQFSEGLVVAHTIGPALGAWLPNLILLVIAIALLMRALRERVAGRAFDRPRARNFSLRRRKKEDEEPVRTRPRRLALQRYVSGRFIHLVLLSFAVLFIAYLLIDVMDRLAWFTRYEATGIEVVRFYGARVWLLASRAVPMAVLVATALVVSLLAVEGELLGMRACGIPAPKALLPVLVIAVVIAPLYFTLNNVVVPRTNALADVLKRTEIKDKVTRQKAEEKKAGYWYRSGSQVLEADLFDPDRGLARELTIYDLGPDGLPVARTDAVSARHIGEGWWRLRNPTRVEVHDGRLDLVDPPRHVQLGDTVEAKVDTMHLPVNQIAEEARSLERDDIDATPFWVDYYVRLAEPFSLIVLPAAVLFFAVGGPPFPGPAQTLLLSGVIGVAYIMIGAIASSMGRGGTLDPVLSAWGPVFLFAVLAGFFAFRIRTRI
jgi:LPS export ABC transporter permease LptF/LPS export ABC transporter permease LptG